MKTEAQDEFVGQVIEKPWGNYTILSISKNFKVKNITVLPGHRISLQLHHHRSENWVIVDGTALVNIGTEEFLLKQGDSAFINISEIHRLTNTGQIPLQVIEVQIGDLLSETDIIRFEDDYRKV